MSSKSTRQAKPKRRPARHYSGLQKSEAVLSVWSERRRPAEVCRELGISWQVLNQWQNRALEGMVATLEPRTSTEEQRPPALSARLEKLLAKQRRKEAKPKPLSSGLTRRLSGLREPQKPSAEEKE